MMLNKLLFFPISILFIVGTLSVIAPTGFEETIIDMNAGYIIDDYAPMYYWHNNASGSEYYLKAGASIFGSNHYNPYVDFADPLFIVNMDSGKTMFFDDWADFLATFSESEFTAEQPNLLDASALWYAIGAILILVGIVSFTAFGIGFSETGQGLLLVSLLFGAIWTFLTLSSINVIFNGLGVFGPILYGILTLMFVMGYIFELTSDGID